MKNTLSNNKSRFLSILVILAAILSPIAVHAQNSYLFASVNGNTQNLGGAVFQYTPPGAQTTFAPGLSRPRGLAIYQGNLYVATNTVDPVTGNAQESIVKVSASGVQTLFATFSNVNFAAEGLAIDGAGNVFVLAFDLTSPVLASTIFKFTPDGTESTFATDLADPRGIAFAPSGDLLVAELKAAAPGDILKFSTNGSQTVFASGIGQPQGNGGPEFLTFRGGPALP